MPARSKYPDMPEDAILAEYANPAVRTKDIVALYGITYEALRALVHRRNVARRPHGRRAGGPPVPPRVTSGPRPVYGAPEVVVPLSTPPDRKVSCIRTTGSPPSAWHQRNAEEAIKAREKQAEETPKPPKGARWGDPVPHVVDYPTCAWNADGTPRELTKDQKYDWDFSQNQKAEERAAGIVPDVHVH
jgi:hypothetical protein